MRPYWHYHLKEYMAKPRKRVKYYRHKLRAWVMDGNPNGVTKIVSFVHC